VQGKLHLSGTDELQLSARVVRYGQGPTAHFSWHGDLTRHDGKCGVLILDDGTTTSVYVAAPFLRTSPVHA